MTWNKGDDKKDPVEEALKKDAKKGAGGAASKDKLEKILKRAHDNEKKKGEDKKKK